MGEYRPFIVFVVLAVATGLLGVLIACKAEQNEVRRASFRERDLKEKATLELGEEVTERIRMAFRVGLTLDEFREVFGTPTELLAGTDPRYADMTHSLLHKKSQRTFYLRFQGERLAGFTSEQGAGDVNTEVVLETPAFRRGESMRTCILFGGVVAWGGVLLTGVRCRWFRARAGVLLVALSIVCGLCGFLAPNYSATWRGVSSNDSLLIFGVLLIVSLAQQYAAVRDRSLGRPAT